jgi:NTE family protein
MTEAHGELALVLGGGGARAAYQVGFLRALGRMFPELEVPILTGVSAGAISAAFLANHPGVFGAASEDLARLWESLTVDTVFRSDTSSLLSHSFRWGLRLISGGKKIGQPARGMVDTQPLREFLTEVLHAPDGKLSVVDQKLAAGSLRSLAITTTKYGTNQSITWVQGRSGIDWSRANRRSVRADITVEHVMASCALPLFFPAIQIGGEWHGDGGIRLMAPLAPALHLGAGRLIAISTRYQRTQIEAERPATEGYPPPATVLGVMLSAIFLDMLDYDAINLQRLNELLDQLPPEKRLGLRTASLLLLRPSQDIGKLATVYEPSLPGLFRFLTRGMGTRETKSPDSLSMVLFEPEYLRRLIEIGEADAIQRREEITAFVAGEKRPALSQTGFWRI